LVSTATSMRPLSSGSSIATLKLMQGGVEAVTSQTPAEFNEFIQAVAKRRGKAGEGLERDCGLMKS